MGGTAALALAGASMYKAKVDADKVNAKATRDYRQRVAEVQRQQQADAEVRQEKLAKASATQRARFAAEGLNPADGSSGAVIDGLKQKTQRELDERSAVYDAELKTVRSSFADMQADQLQKKNNASDLLLGDDRNVRRIKDWN